MAKYKVTVTVEFDDCTNCSFKKYHKGHGECWDCCSHANAPSGYDNIIYGCNEKFKGIPKWCPIIKESNEL